MVIKVFKLIIAIWIFVGGVLMFFYSLGIIFGGVPGYSLGGGIVGLLFSILWMRFFWRWVKETIREIEHGN